MKTVTRKAPGLARHEVTMRDIAQAASVSQSTVSRVLSGAESSVPIASATRDRILEVADRLRYRPNPLARGLRGAATMLLGVIVREITDPFFAGAVDAISSEARARGYNVVLGHAHGRADEAIALRAVLETRHCDAILLLGESSDQPRLHADLHEARVPVVALWQGSAPGQIQTVSVDNRFGIHALLDHLTTLGHRDIAFIGGRPRLGDISERRAAYVEYMTGQGLFPSDAYAPDAANDLEEASRAMAALLRLPRPPTAVVASTDLQAIGALHAADVAGVRVPEDVSVVGFDDINLAAYAVPALTTVHNPVSEMSAVAVRAALDGGERQPSRGGSAPVTLLRPSLVIRGSSGLVPAPAISSPAASGAAGARRLPHGSRKGRPLTP